MEPHDENFYLSAHEEMVRWPLMDSPWPIVTILSVYLLFVIKVGPEFMKHRKPFNLKPAILVYNLYQVFFNAYIFSKIFADENAFIPYLSKHGCHPIDPAKNPLWFPISKIAWLFFISRITDLFDTVFFVLTKKQSHVSFLHLLHHTEVALFTYLYLRYMQQGEQAVVFVILNTFTHVMIYTYLFVAALGPQYRKFLWWKEFLSQIQLLQFFLIAAYTAFLIIADCSAPRNVSLFFLVEAVMFFVLFGSFYWKTYIVKNRPKKPARSTE